MVILRACTKVDAAAYLRGWKRRAEGPGRGTLDLGAAASSPRGREGGREGNPGRGACGARDAGGGAFGGGACARAKL